MTGTSSRRIRRRALTIASAAITVVALTFASAAGASALKWHTYRVPGAPRFATVRCPSNSVCVALTHRGQVFTTRNASAPRPSWKLTVGLTAMGPEESSEQTTAYNLSCPSVHLCVTSRLPATILTSTDPTGPASVWHAVDIQPAGLNAEGKIDSLSCPSVALCVAGMNEWSNEEGGGTSLDIATATDPTGPAAAWSIAASPANADYLTEIACSPGGLCAGGDEGSSVLATAHVTAGRSGWSRVASLHAQLEYVACPSVSECIGADFVGRLTYSLAPATSSRWHSAALAARRYLNTVSCSSTRFCAATGGDGHHLTAVLTSTRPEKAAAWTFTSFSARGDRLNAISCRSSSFCVAVGDRGLVVVHRRGG
ncbi:MAG: hypothetical protein ACR2NR_17570 [Solirubrobacteraceae bacterium]